MNILLTTSAILLVLTLACYVKVDLFRQKAGFSAALSEYMATSERNIIDAGALKRYDEVRPGSKTASEDDKKTAAPTIRGIRRLPIRGWLLKSERDKKPAEAMQIKRVFGKLLIALYANEPFWINRMRKESIGDSEHLVDLLLQAIEEGADRYAESNTLDNIRQLGLFSLGEWQELYASVLNGCPCGATFQVVENPEAVDEEGGDAPEDLVDINRRTIKNFISFSTKNQVSVWLAPKMLLQAIFSSDMIVDDLLQTRAKLSQEYLKSSGSPEAFQEAFNRFKSEPAELSLPLLDFTISKTKP